MNTDFRVKTEFFQHHKTKRLRKRLGAEGLVALWQLWAYASKFRPDGYLAGMSDEDIELAVDWPGESGALVTELRECGWLDGEPGKYSLHDWQEHNPWAAEADERSAKALMSKLSQVNKSAFNLLKKQGKQGLTRAEYDEWKEYVEDAGSEIQRPQSDRLATATAIASESLAPSPSPSPALTQEEKRGGDARACVDRLGETPPEEVPDPGGGWKPSGAFDRMSWISFCKAFAQWPVQQQRKKAWAVWERLRLEGRLPDQFIILDRIQTLKAYDAYWAKGKTPAFWRWLEDERWDDEPVEKPPTPLAPVRATTVAQQGAQMRDQLARALLMRGGIGNAGAEIDRTGLVEPDRALLGQQDSGRADGPRRELAGGSGGAGRQRLSGGG